MRYEWYTQVSVEPGTSLKTQNHFTVYIHVVVTAVSAKGIEVER